ncbi:glycogen/starch/alpha-glucan phosphorylase [Vibrio coralliilyticus]|uniref:glycogen/starch/alpha-glucan phosphorylase n=1 Tax=Vibrio coralliilyticus TaxID=190893 RepID=UPI001560B0C7|nr:glycogen/starch/alpha-glucan phosphorylase [Vibrio coralliilyticus]NRF29888.1 glycogen/starch/alpha-glucan phosphorylase [Vibrio coralliilyticus]NRF51304.1 glycogen/starch/alpha-glucan phosphorylase [Vibrio coralliilyticus]NRG02456.1 glycogen/starch/alpha-glucan phosphorylase [Vibrio coralliilyticus]NUW70796.1 glycogen/starch/alpha-glucan phosphorylase [Vibrio coralliilyticus]WFB49417.1 glycogen/starch/alpha-glucan phosphorylase [Vibrio coralliilyticus]
MKPTQQKNFDKASFQESVKKHLTATYATTVEKADSRAWYLAMGRALAELTTFDMLQTEQDDKILNAKSVNYLSLEFLIGRLTGNNLISLGLYEQITAAMEEMGQNLTDLLEEERDPSLGNGGLGRLAACFMDSLAAQEFPTVGYGLHYEYGLFKQSFQEGHQQEAPDAWRGVEGYPWEVARPELAQEIGFYGHVEVYHEDGKEKRRWVPGMSVKAMPWDLPIVGYESDTVYPLRLWECQAIAPFSLASFNNGDYFEAQHSLIDAGNITKVLYPNDNHEKGKTLRLMQQYFHSAASVRDILRRHEEAGHTLASLPKYETIQLNDTHPTIAIPELMRILIDEKGLGWDEAWDISSKTFAYTNHTLLPEALETWSESLIQRLLPRHMEIIYHINHLFLQEVRQKWPGDVAKQQKLSIIQEGFHRMVRMANLCVIGSYAVNGVAALHSELVKRDLFPEFDELYPTRLHNVTNGITPRRWLKFCNPGLSALISDKIGTEWPAKLEQLEQIAKFADDAKFQKEFMAVKKENKQRLADWVSENMGIELDTNAIFDVQIKRLHEYKRQHLNMLHILSLYHRLLNDPDFDMAPRVVFFAAKAAPGYHLAKEIIYAINKIAEKVNNDPRIGNKLKVVFIPDYRVSMAEIIIPAADVSEQISTAGKEASGTGNMKMALNGALTIGTMDGANVEIREEVGDDNIYIFGLEVDGVEALRAQGYNPFDYYHADPLLKASLELLLGEEFTPGEPGKLRATYDSLLDGGDPYLCLADFASYVKAHEDMDKQYRDQAGWAKKAILNTALVGKFSSDRSIRDYVNNIWKLESVKR